MSLFCAAGATRVQEWLRRYQLLTQLCSNSRRGSARIRASISEDGFLEFIPLVLNVLNTVLQLSIYLFLLGLLFFVFFLNDSSSAVLVGIFFVLASAGYLYSSFRSNLACFFPRHIPHPHHSILFSFNLLPIYGRDIRAFCFWKTLLGPARQIEKDASTPSRALTLDADAMSWLLNSLTDEEDYERFVAGIPGFYRSTQVEDPAKVLQKASTDAVPKAILAFLNRSQSSDLPEETRQQRIKLSLEAMKAHPYLLQRSFYHALRACSTESVIFKSIDFVLLADQHANDVDVYIRSIAREIITIAIDRLDNYHADKRWAGIVQRRLNWPEDLFHKEQHDNIKLCNLIQLARELSLPGTSCDSHIQEIFGDLLHELCKFDVGNMAPKLQNEFCELWNHLVNNVQLLDQNPALLSNMMLILSFIRAIHASLHHNTESQSTPISANTTSLDPALQSPPSYSPCTVPDTSANPSTNILITHDCMILEMPRRNDSPCMSA